MIPEQQGFIVDAGTFDNAVAVTVDRAVAIGPGDAGRRADTGLGADIVAGQGAVFVPEVLVALRIASMSEMVDLSRALTISS